MPTIFYDLPPSAFSALRLSPDEFAREMRIAACVHWYDQGRLSQGKAAEIAGLTWADFLEELFRRRVPAFQVTLEELKEEAGVDEGEPDPETFGFEPFPHRGPAVMNELVDRLRDEEGTCPASDLARADQAPRLSGKRTSRKIS